jgi:hypothetical protein
MREGEPGWFYVGNGKLRYKDSEAWTDRYQDIDEVAAAHPMNCESSGPADATVSPAMRQPRRRTSTLAMAVCTGLLGLGVVAGLHRADVSRGLVSWVSVQAGQISALFSPPAPHTQAISDNAKVKVKAKTTQHHSAAPHALAAKPVPTRSAIPPAGPRPMATKATVTSKPSPTWDGGSYTGADYAARVGDVPMWIGKVRLALDGGYEITTSTDLAGLGNRCAEIGRLPAPPRVDPAWWAASNATLSLSSQQAADNWVHGHQIAAVAGFEVVVKTSNELVTKVNAAFGFHIPLSKTAVFSHP